MTVCDTCKHRLPNGGCNMDKICPAARNKGLLKGGVADLARMMGIKL